MKIQRGGGKSHPCNKFCWVSSVQQQQPSSGPGIIPMEDCPKKKFRISYDINLSSRFYPGAQLGIFDGRSTGVQFTEKGKIKLSKEDAARGLTGILSLGMSGLCPAEADSALSKIHP